MADRAFLNDGTALDEYALEVNAVLREIDGDRFAEHTLFAADGHDLAVVNRAQTDVPRNAQHALATRDDGHPLVAAAAQHDSSAALSERRSGRRSGARCAEWQGECRMGLHSTCRFCTESADRTGRAPARG